MIGVAWVGAAILIGVAVLQTVLALGAPYGGVAWGGRRKGKLPWYLRVASAIAVPLLLGFAYVILARAGVFGESEQRVPAFVVAAVLTLNVVGNFASQSFIERWVLGPLAVVAAVAAWLVAIWG
ncbi:MAG: hypothetical protein KIS96_04095 [Bauldia sp.]|nr:hypothetical protein [Bauldia sp.]